MKKLLFFLSLMNFMDLAAQENLGYQLPHPSIMTLADAKPAPSMSIDAKATKALLMYRNNYKSIEELSMEEMRLAGLRIDPSTSLSSRTNYVIDLKFLDPLTRKVSKIQGLPNEGKYSKMAWNHAQDKVAVLNSIANGVELWLIDLNTLEAKRLTEANVHGSLGTTMAWDKDDQSILVKWRVNGIPKLTNRDLIVPTGPTISENDGQKAQNRTYQDLLKNPTDEANFELLATSSIKKVSLDGTMQDFLPAAMYDDMTFSPDGSLLMISCIKRPFSYIVPLGRFPTTYSIYTKDGKLVKDVFEVPLIEEMPKGFMAVPTHPRSINWRSDKPATLTWVLPLDEGDPEKEVPYRDVVMEQDAPFESAPREMVKTKERYAGIIYGDAHNAILYERWWNTRNLRVLKFDPSDANVTPQLISERNYQDLYNDPGSFVTDRNEYGKQTLVINNDQVYLMGDGYSEKGKFPFVDRMDFNSFKTERVYQVTAEDKLEDFLSFIDTEEGTILTRIESSSEYPNYYIRNIYSGSLTPVTQNENPFKILEGIHKEVITYKREDGVDLTATLLLPVGYDKSKKEKLPMIMWAYPREFKDASTASQTTSNPNEFTFPYWGSPLYWVNRGYAVLDDAAFPIIGEGDEQPNDSFIKQLVANAKAGIDAVDEMGYIDRRKVAVGGHSYGAFMTANLLTHSDLFAAGIARSGAYNRTLTPFGFQSEERSYWDAPEVYYDMSPFMHADKMKTPLLLVHGEADNNSGTYPMQSERYFNALKGLGATVRLVMLPKESHGYVARESILHLLWEQDQWLDKYVKNRDIENRP